MIDISMMPGYLAGHSENLRNVSDAELWAEVASWLDRLSEDNKQEYEFCVWFLRAALAELERRLAGWYGWLDGSIQPLPAWQTDAVCAKCGNSQGIRSLYCSGGWSRSDKFRRPLTRFDAKRQDVRRDPEAICYLRQEADVEHMHRLCPGCGYEWLEGCPASGG